MPSDTVPGAPVPEGVGPSRWRALGVLCTVSSLVTGGLIASLSLYAPVIEQAEHWDALTLGAAGTILLLSLSLAGILAGYALECVQARVVIAAGLALAAAGCWLAAVSHAVAPFLGGFALIGAGSAAATTVPSIPLITSYFEHKRGLGLGLYFAAMAAAAAGLPLMVADGIAGWGWRMTLQATGVAAVASCLLLPFLRQPSSLAAEHSGDAGETAGLSVQQAFATVSVRRLTGAMILAQLSIQAVLFTTVSYLRGGGYAMGQAVVVYSCANLFSVPAGIAVGALADRLGSNKVLPVGLWVQAVGTLAMIGACAGGVLGWAALGVFVIGWGISSSIQLQIGPLLLRDLVGGRHFAPILSYTLAAVGLIGALAPLLSSMVERLTGGYAALFAICGAFSALAAVLTTVFRPRAAAFAA